MTGGWRSIQAEVRAPPLPITCGSRSNSVGRDIHLEETAKTEHERLLPGSSGCLGKSLIFMVLESVNSLGLKKESFSVESNLWHIASQIEEKENKDSATRFRIYLLWVEP